MAIGGKRCPAELKPGCLVIVQKFAGERYFPDPVNDNEEFLIVKINEILAWVEE